MIKSNPITYEPSKGLLKIVDTWKKTGDIGSKIERESYNIKMTTCLNDIFKTHQWLNLLFIKSS